MPDASVARPSASARHADTQTRTFASSREDVAAIDDWIETLGPQWDESERTMFRVRLCVAELAANVVEHGIPQSGDDDIVVTLRQAGDAIEIEFVDARGPFDPTRGAARPDTGGLIMPGGRGLMLINAYATDLSYRRDGIHNRTTLKIAR